MPRTSKPPPEPPKPVSWNVYYAGKVGRWVGTIEAVTGRAAIAAFAERAGHSPHKLFVIRRR